MSYNASILQSHASVPSIPPPAAFIELIPNRLSWVTCGKQESLTPSDLPPPTPSSSYHYFTTDTTLTYSHFFADWGPLNLGHLVRFTTHLDKLLTSTNKHIVYCTSSHQHRRTNAIYLITCWTMIRLGKTVAEAYRPFFNLQPPPFPFRDAAFSVCPYTITVVDCLHALQRALTNGHFNPVTFDPNEYDAMDKIENGDCTWIVPGKLMAFSGPLDKRREIGQGVWTMGIEEYAALFKKYGVTGVIRFNKKLYDRQQLVKRGVNHYDMYYEDGANPPDSISAKFLKVTEQEKGAVAVHCKAGLGRTGTNISNYMIKHYGYTANECIAWCRMSRPGSVVGPQQNYMADAEAKVAREGEIFYRRERGEKGAYDSGPGSAVKRGGAGGGLLLRSHSPVNVDLNISANAAPMSPPKSPEKDALELNNLEKMKEGRTISTSPIRNRNRNRPPANRQERERMPQVTGDNRDSGGMRSTSSRLLGGGAEGAKAGERPRSVGGRRVQGR